MGPYLERYLQGECRGVWHDLLALSEQVRQEPVLSDASAVAHETMSRVRENLTTLDNRLQSMGYRYRNPSPAFLPPPPDVATRIAELEARAGVLPLSLRAFYETVGSVDLTGEHPDWRGCDDPDALVVLPIASALHELDDWEHDKKAYERAFGSFRVPIAPDHKHKENVSGGMWYGIGLPDPNADAILLEEYHNTTFVEYLRLCLQWGGFPRLEHADPTHTWPIEQLTLGLVDF